MEQRGQPGPASVCRYDTHTPWPSGRGCGLKKNTEKEKKSCRLLILARRLIPLYFPPMDNGSPRDQLCDVTAYRKQKKRDVQHASKLSTTVKR